MKQFERNNKVDISKEDCSKAFELNSQERKVIQKLQHYIKGGYFVGYAEIQNEAGLTTYKVREAFYSLKDKGLSTTEPIFREWDGMANGKGWFLTDAGLRVRTVLERIKKFSHFDKKPEP